jgi:hypothetical protein
MKRGAIAILKLVVVLIAVLTLTGLVWFPQTEGRAAHLELISIYLDPLIIYIYIGSIPFFAVLQQSLKLLKDIEANKVFSQVSVRAFRSIKYYALTLSVTIMGALLYIRFFAGGDDPAGPTALGIIAIFASFIVAAAANVCERLLQNVVDIKSENDLTV